MTNNHCGAYHKLCDECAKQRMCIVLIVGVVVMSDGGRKLRCPPKSGFRFTRRPATHAAAIHTPVHPSALFHKLQKMLR